MGTRRLPKHRIPTHPGEVLREEFLEPLGLTQVEVADHLSVPLQRLNEIVRGKRGVTPETAWLLAEAFETTPQFWLALQANHDLAKHRPERRVKPLQRTAQATQGASAPPSTGSG